MSSTDFDTAYDTIVSRVASLLSGHVRLRDSYNLEQNPESFLKKGYGIAVGRGGENTFRFVGPKRSTKITYQIIITRQVFALDSDPASKATTDKNLLEDLRVIVDDIWQNNFNISGSPLITFADFEGVSPIRVGTDSFLYVSLNLQVEYIVTS